jgi:hypothetical protein
LQRSWNNHSSQDNDKEFLITHHPKIAYATVTDGWSLTLVEKTSDSVSQNKALVRDTGCKQQDSFIERKMYRQEEIPQDRVVGSDQMTQNS